MEVAANRDRQRRGNGAPSEIGQDFVVASKRVTTVVARRRLQGYHVNTPAKTELTGVVVLVQQLDYSLGRFLPGQSWQVLTKV